MALPRPFLHTPRTPAVPATATACPGRGGDGPSLSYPGDSFKRAHPFRGRLRQRPHPFRAPSPPGTNRLSDGRWLAFRGGGQLRVPATGRAGVAESGAGEVEGEVERIGGRGDVLPLEHVLAEFAVPAAAGDAQIAVGEARIGRVGVGVEGGAAVFGVARPPADRDLLGVH